VAHVIQRRSGYLWLGITLTVELVLGISSGFLMPVILPCVLCVTVAAALDRLRGRHVALIAAAGIVVSTFVPVIAAVRQDRMGVIGTSDLARVEDALVAPVKYWLAGVSAGDGAYNKFFGRQTEVAGAPGLVVLLTPAIVPFEGLDRFLALPAGLIPRAFWPDKPTLSRGVWFSSTFRGLKQDTTSYSAMTIFSEGYLFYGWTGTVLAMLIVGAMLAVIHRRLDNPRLVPVYLALVPTILQIEPEFSSYLTTLVQRSVVFLLAFVLLAHTTGEGFWHRRIRP
jgi:TM2 domain-containing membrane protein YozV